MFGHHRSVLNSVCETLREKVMMPSYTERREVMNSSFFMQCKDVRLVLSRYCCCEFLGYRKKLVLSNNIVCYNFGIHNSTCAN